MTDLFKSKEHEFYIELKQDRYYFPGEDISGDVILDITKATKTNNIKVVLEGIVEMGGRTITLFSKYVLIAQSPDGEKSYYLEPLTHRFPFVITIPTAKECSVPSTLEIAKLLKVSYKLTAIFNKPFAVLEKFSASTTKTINILENINVESTEYGGDYKVEKKLTLTRETKPVKVSTVIGKRAAVKGDTIPILVTIEHIGVMVRDKAISVQLLRSVYYGRNKSELFGPKTLREVTSNVQILGPTNFTKTFDLRLALPPNLCPTVEKSGQTFKIEYTLRISVNLNEENPYRPEVPQNIVLFNVPFTIGTYPKLSFNIDDDEDDKEEEEMEQKDQQRDEVGSNHSSEYDQVAEKMKEMDLSLEAVPPQMIQQFPKPQPPTTPPPKNAYTPLPALSTSPKPTYIPPPMMAKQEPKPQVMEKDSKPDAPSSPSTESFVQVPMMISKLSPVPPMLSSTVSSPSVTPLERLPSSGSIAVPPMVSSPPLVKPLERLSSNGSTISPVTTPKMEFTANNNASPPTKFSPQQQPIGSPKSPASYFNSNSPTTTVTTPPPERVNQQQNVSSYTSPKVNIRPSEIFNDYKPVISPTSSIPRHDSVASIQPSTSTSTSNNAGLGRQDSVHWIVGNQDAPAPAAVLTSPVISNSNNAPPALPPRPTPSPVNNTVQPGFNLPQPDINATSAPPPPFPTNNYHHQQQQQQQNSHHNHHYPPQPHHQSSYPPPLQHYDSFSGGSGMPVAQPAPPPQYNYNNYNSNQYGNAPPPPPSQQYNNNYNHHPLHYDNNVSFPVPQHPYTHGGSVGVMGMPSHQNYVPHHNQPHPQQHAQYPSFYNDH